MAPSDGPSWSAMDCDSCMITGSHSCLCPSAFRNWMDKAGRVWREPTPSAPASRSRVTFIMFQSVWSGTMWPPSLPARIGESSQTRKNTRMLSSVRSRPQRRDMGTCSFAWSNFASLRSRRSVTSSSVCDTESSWKSSDGRTPGSTSLAASTRRPAFSDTQSEESNAGSAGAPSLNSPCQDLSLTFTKWISKVLSLCSGSASSASKHHHEERGRTS
mmetsp:Transcript_17452/g.36036  ORF Transcript_17452/g.36036 Transcript_17452/m.36036 type:complete len:216 (-) Transcript_17452:12-659(-)